MDGRPVLVTGAAGFIGARLVAALYQRGIPVRAGMRNPARAGLLAAKGIEIVPLDLAKPDTLTAALENVGTVFHFAALVDAHATLDQLRETNLRGTRRLWMAAAASGVERLVYCSTTAVYGLAAAGRHPIDEAITPRALEPYGRTKLEGEKAAREIAAATGMDMVVIRPTAVFGPGERTGIGRTLRRVAVSRVVMPGSDTDWTFSFVHVDDVVRAALHLAERPECFGNVFNVAVEPPLPFAAAFASYRQVVGRIGLRRWRERILAILSSAVHEHADWQKWLPGPVRRRWVHDIWRPGWDLTYSSSRLRQTGFRFEHTDFTEVLNECLGGG